MKYKFNVSMQTYVGLVVTLAGIGFVLDTVGLLDFSALISLWWPSIVIVFALLSLVISSSNKVNSVIILSIGILLQFQAFKVIDFNLWSLIWPILLVWFGINLILSNGRRINRKNNMPEAEDFTEKVIEEFVVLAGSEKRIITKDFKGGNVTALLGGIKLDFRKSTFAKDAELNIMAMFGGVEIIVPEDCKVITKGTAILGGFSNKTDVDEKNVKYTLVLNGTSALGGVEVKN